MGILPGMCVCVLYTCLVLQEMRVGYWSPWNCNYRWLWATVWVLGIEHNSSGRSAIELSLISSALCHGNLSIG